MNIWLLHIGEDLPIDGKTRLFRYGYLAQAIQEQGHQVLRWAPTFRHSTKTQRFSTDIRIKMTPEYAIQFVHAPGYRQTTSLARLRTYQILGKRFRQLAENESPPDVLVAAIPSLEWADAAVAYGRSHQVPVVVDVRDLWPDVFPSALPAGARSIGRLLLAPYKRIARRACQNADALTAVSETYLDWALQHARRRRRPTDLVVPLGFEPTATSPEALREKLSELQSLGVDPRRSTCYFAGGFERHHDIETIVEAARKVIAAGHGDLQFVLCGDGSKSAAIRRQAAGLNNIHFLGMVDAAMLQAVASISVVGLCAYAEGALMSLGNKPYEYMAGRLAIVSSLPGELAELLDRQQCGLSYQAGNADSLARVLIELAADSTRLDAMRANGYRTWVNHYRSRNVYSRFVEHLTKVAAPAAQAA
jgi:glycosyltransferase involved in cell wall biosynthesis